MNSRFQTFSPNKKGNIKIKLFTLVLLTVLFSFKKAKAQEVNTYTVKKGDTLWAIALRFFNDGNKWHELAEINNLTNPRMIHRGNVLLVSSTENMLSNANFNEEDLGTISYWSDFNLTLNRWYLTQDKDENKGIRWAERVNLALEPGDREGYGIKSIDKSNCNSYCDTSILQLVEASEGSTYKLSTEAKRTKGGGGTLYLDFLDSKKVRIKATTKGGLEQNSWTQVEISDTAPPRTKYIRVILYSNNEAEGEIYWDKVRLEKI